MNSKRFVLPKGAGFYNLFERRHEPDGDERKTNGTKLT
jgi:hypothetical protein